MQDKITFSSKKVEIEENGVKRTDFPKNYTPPTTTTTKFSLPPLASTINLHFMTLNFRFKVYLFTVKVLLTLI